MIEFLNGISRYTPEQLNEALKQGEIAREKHAQNQERAKEKRQLNSLDKALLKHGLID